MNEDYDDNDDYNGGDADDDDNDNVADYEVGDVAVTADDGSYLYTNQFPFPIVYIVWQVYWVTSFKHIDLVAIVSPGPKLQRAHLSKDDIYQTNTVLKVGNITKQ